MNNDIFTIYENVSPPDNYNIDEVIQNYLNNPVDDYDTLQQSLYYPQSKPGFFPRTNFFNLPKAKESNTSTSSIVQTAKNYLGTKYRWGGSNPSTGFDCSGFINYIFKQNGYAVPRTVKGLEKAGKEISLSEVQPGDIITSNSKGSPSGKHVKLVTNVKDGQIYTIDARGRKYGVIEDTLTNTNNITSVRRLT